jgi:hypothetical protein
MEAPMNTTKVRNLTTMNIRALESLEAARPGTVLALGATYALLPGLPAELALLLDRLTTRANSRSLAAVKRKINDHAVGAYARGTAGHVVVSYGVPQPKVSIDHHERGWAVLTTTLGCPTHAAAWPGADLAESRRLAFGYARARADRLGDHELIVIRCQRGCGTHGHVVEAGTASAALARAVDDALRGAAGRLPQHRTDAGGWCQRSGDQVADCAAGCPDGCCGVLGVPGRYTRPTTAAPGWPGA